MFEPNALTHEKCKKGMSTADDIASSAYGEDGQYCRPNNAQLRAAGGVLVSSSNDEQSNGGWSFSPTDEWRFPDGSELTVAYSMCN